MDRALDAELDELLFGYKSKWIDTEQPDICPPFLARLNPDGSIRYMDIVGVPDEPEGVPYYTADIYHNQVVYQALVDEVCYQNGSFSVTTSAFVDGIKFIARLGTTIQIADSHKMAVALCAQQYFRAKPRSHAQS